VKRFARDWLPPIAVRGIKRIRSPRTARFFGVYSEASACKAEGQFESPEWLAQQRLALATNVHPWQHVPSIHSPRALTALHLNLLSRSRRISVLDFGGASGEIFFDLRRGGALLYLDNISWTVVDSLPALRIGEEFRIEGERIDFQTVVPQRTFDVPHVSTVFQYIPNITAAVDELLTTNPDHVILTRLLAGDIPDFFTRNYAFGRWEPLHFFNYSDLESQFHRHGLQTVLRQSKTEEVLNPGDFSDVPSDHQISSTAHLIMVKGTAMAI